MANLHSLDRRVILISGLPVTSISTAPRLSMLKKFYARNGNLKCKVKGHAIIILGVSDSRRALMDTTINEEV